jgi:hypothetical protein
VASSAWAEWTTTLRERQDVKEAENEKKALGVISGFANPINAGYALEVRPQRV